MKTNRLLTILAAVLLWALCTAALAGCGRLADPIVLPRVADVDSVEVCSDTTRHTTSDRGWIIRALRGLGQATPTRRASIQDCPQAEDMLEVHFRFAQGASTLFLYREKGKCYVEQPYQGIWRITEDVYALFEGT